MATALTIKQIEAFVEVADLGGFNRAAQRLGTTQPNISSRISTLEKLLGVTLMERDAGSVRLTPRGRELLERARAVLAATDALRMAADNPSAVDGVLRLGVTEMVAHTWLRDFLKAMRGAFPNVGVELAVDLSANVEKDLLNRALDLAFHNAPFVQEVTGAVDLGKWPLIWVGAPGVVAGEGASLAVGALREATIITHSRGTRLHDEVKTHFAATGHPAQGMVSSSNLAVCLHMAMEGFGLAAVPEAMAADALARGALTRIPYAWHPEPLHFMARFEASRNRGFVRHAAELAVEVARRHGGGA